MNGKFKIRQGPVSGETDVFGRAVFSECERFRFQLQRSWVRPGIVPRVATWVMLNPSTATESKNDPTITRCIGFSRDWGFDGLFIVNLWPLRSTDPRALKTYDGDADEHADFWIADALELSQLVVCAWGNHGTQARAAHVMKIIQRANLRAHALQVTKAGMPSHPLYLRSTLKPVPYSPAWSV